MIKTLTKHAVGRRTIPILGQVRVKGGVMQTTDMDFWISGPCPLADGMYHSHGFDKGIQIKSELPVTDFPEPNKNNKKYDKAALVIDRAAADTLAWVLKAASKEAARYYLNGVFFDWTEEQAVIVATDGHRLHSFTHAIDAPRPKKARKKQADGKYKMVAPSAGAIMPTRGVKIILDLMKETGAGRVDIEFEGLLFTARIGDALVQGKLIDGTFPAWRQVVPNCPPGNTTLYNPEEIKALVPELSIINKIGANARTLGVAIKAGKARNTEVISGVKREWPVSTQLPFEAGFNSKYLMDLCGGVLHYIDHTSPFKVVDRRGGIERMGVIMPMRV